MQLYNTLRLFIVLILNVLQNYYRSVNCSKSGIIRVCPFNSHCFPYSYISVRLPKAHIHRTYTLKGCVIYLSRIVNEFLFENVTVVCSCFQET